RLPAQGTGPSSGRAPGEATADSLKSRPASFKRLLGGRAAVQLPPFVHNRRVVQEPRKEGATDKAQQGSEQHAQGVAAEPEPDPAKAAGDPDRARTPRTGPALPDDLRAGEGDRRDRTPE